MTQVVADFYCSLKIKTHFASLQQCSKQPTFEAPQALDGSSSSS